MLTLIERLERRHALAGDCWLWTGKRDRDGYGRIVITISGVRHERLVHRVAYLLLRGDLPDELDHTCRNRACFNPEHLEGVTHAENCRRATMLITACPQGHPYDAPNTRVTDGKRYCRICNRDAQRRRRERLARH